MTSSASPRIGILGLGIMGSAFATHLIKAGFAVHGYDPVPARRAALRKVGGRPETSAGAVAAAAEVLITSVPTVTAVGEVAAEIARRGRRGTVVIETSTMPIPVKEAARALLAKRGITLLDCCVSGTGAQARVKDLAIYASGPKKIIDSLDAVFKGFSRVHYNVGAFGAGSKMKFIANLLVTIHNVSAAEAIVMGKRAGLDPHTVVKVIGDGAGSSRVFQMRGPLMADANYGNATASVKILQKDISIITEFARDNDCPTPLFGLSTALYNAAMALGYENDDPAAVCAVLERWAGTDAVGVPAPSKRRGRARARR